MFVRDTWCLGALVAVVSLFFSGKMRAEVIDTTPFWSGGETVAPFGEPGATTFGQTITVGSDSVLNRFTLFLQPFHGPDAVEFRGYVAEWDGSKALAPILFESGDMSTPPFAPGSPFAPYTVDTGNLQLTPGKQYVVFFSTARLLDGENGDARAGYIGRLDAYPGGEFVYIQVTDLGDTTRYAWAVNPFGNHQDLAFKAALSPVPEPSTLVLLGLGAVGLLVCAWRRRRPRA